MQKLTVQTEGDKPELVECGCTFTLKGGFVYKCERHLSMQAKVAKRRKKVNGQRYDLLGPIPKGKLPRAAVALPPAPPRAVFSPEALKRIKASKAKWIKQQRAEINAARKKAGLPPISRKDKGGDDLI